MKINIKQSFDGVLGMKYIIKSVSMSEIEILEQNGIGWYPDSTEVNNYDVAIDDEREYERALILLRRR